MPGWIGSLRGAARGLVLAIAVVLVLGPASQASADGRRDLDDGIAFYDALDTDRAKTRLVAASRAWDLAPAERSVAFLYLGMLSFELGQRKAARRAWQAALVLDASIRPPSEVSPKIARAFERVRATLPDPPPPVPKQDPPPPSAGQPPPPGAQARPMPPPAEAPVPPPSLKVTPRPKVAPPPPFVPSVSTEEDDEGVSPWLWVGIGGAVVAATVAVLVVVLTAEDASSECEQGAGGCVRFIVQ